MSTIDVRVAMALLQNMHIDAGTMKKIVATLLMRELIVSEMVNN